MILAGEAFDKVARQLGILNGPMAGGAAIEQFAKRGNPTKYGRMLPVPMLHLRNCDFSFAGVD